MPLFQRTNPYVPLAFSFLSREDLRVTVVNSSYTFGAPDPQIREQMSGHDLYVLTVAFLALKKTVFLEKKNSSQKKKIFFLPFFCATFQCGRYNVFKFCFFLLTKSAQTFFPTAQPNIQPTAQNRFFIS